MSSTAIIHSVLQWLLYLRCTKRFVIRHLNSRLAFFLLWARLAVLQTIFWPQFYIVVLGMTFLLSHTFFIFFWSLVCIWTFLPRFLFQSFISLFYLDFYFSFLFGLSPFFWTSCYIYFQFLFDSIFVRLFPFLFVSSFVCFHFFIPSPFVNFHSIYGLAVT